MKVARISTITPPAVAGATATLRRIGANSGVVAIRLLSVAAGLAYVKAYTHALSTPEVGLFFYLSTLSYAINALVFVPVDFYMQARLASLAAVPARAISNLVLRVLAIGLAVCIAASLPLIQLGKLQWGDLPAMYAVAALLYLCSTLRNLLNNRGRTVFVSAMLLIESSGRLVAFVALAALLNASARTLMISSALGLALELALVLLATRRLARAAEPKHLDDGRIILRTSAPIAGAAVCNAVQLQGYRVAYPLAHHSATSGLFGVVSNIGAAAMSAAGSIYSQLQTPRLYASQGRYVRRFALLAGALACVLLIVALLTAHLLVSTLTGPQYLPYAYAVGFGIVIEACNLIVGGYTIALTISSRTALLFKLNLLAAAVSAAGCCAALLLRPGEPMLIGASLAGSQMLMTLALAALVSLPPVERNH